MLLKAGKGSSRSRFSSLWVMLDAAKSSLRAGGMVESDEEYEVLQDRSVASKKQEE